MKLATLRSGSRDGQLVVVSRDLTRCLPVMPIATLQSTLDEWGAISTTLQVFSDRVNASDKGTMPFDPKACLSPLPRTYQWADGSAYVNHVALVRKARGAEMPESFWTDPLMYQGASDEMLGPRDPIPLADESWGCDLEAEIVVVTDDVPRGVSREEALGHIKLIGLVNDVSLRNLIPAELGKGFGFLQSKPASALSPVLVTPDALGGAWRDGKLHGVLKVDLNGQPFGRADAGEDMTFDFGTLVAHLAKTRNIGAGSIIGSGTVSNRDTDGGPGKPVDRGGRGYSCLAEVRTVETILDGQATTAFLKAGDTVRIWMDDEKGHPIFGAIEQEVVAA